MPFDRNDPQIVPVLQMKRLGGEEGKVRRLCCVFWVGESWFAKVDKTGLMVSRRVIKGRVTLALPSGMAVLVTNKQSASRMALQVLSGKDDGPIVLGRVALDQSLHLNLSLHLSHSFATTPPCNSALHRIWSLRSTEIPIVRRRRAGRVCYRREDSAESAEHTRVALSVTSAA